MRAVGFILGAAMALAALKVAVQLSLAILAIMLVAALILDPIETLIRLGALALLAAFLSSRAAALLLLIAYLLAGLLAAHVSDHRSD